MKSRIFIYAIVVFNVCLAVTGIELFADEIYLKNNDRISGRVVEESEDTVVIKTEALGDISVRKDFIERISFDKEKEGEVVLAEKKEPAVLWEKKISLGYNDSRGNSESSQVTMGFYAGRKTDGNEVTLKADAFYSSSNQEMDAQRWSGMGRYAFSFGEEKKWYNFYKLEADHDRFADIDYRLIPSVGLGYWFSDEVDWKLMAEAALGVEHTNFRTEGDNDEFISICRGYLEKRIFAKARIIQDVFFYPALSSFGEYRLRSETSLENPISDKLSLRLSLIDDYDSHPPKGVEKNDLRLISSLIYLF
ncbi:MAG: DUF481 domain-containing protein [Candidatus Omnitrophica bacterium]|nr:DUF481 domain-containing protein [Candidatus Omnitrophota bacterium]